MMARFRYYFFFAQFGTRRLNNNGFYGLPPFFIRDPDYRHIGNTFNLPNDLFDLSMIDIFSSADNHIFLSISHVNLALGLFHQKSAGFGNFSTNSFFTSPFDSLLAPLPPPRAHITFAFY